MLRNGLRKHELRLDATPNAGYGERFTLTGRFSQPLLARSGDWARWSGTVYADLPGADLARVRDHVTLPFDLRAGTGAARLWLDVSKGQWRRATLDAALNDVALRLAPNLEPLALQRLQGRLEAERQSGGVRLSGQRLAFATTDGASWPASRFSLSLTQQQTLSQPALSTQPVTGGEFSADRLDLAMMAGVAERLPLPAPVRQGLAELAPSGLVQGLQLSWVGPAAQPVHYHVKGRIGGLSIAALPAPEAAASGPAHVGRPAGAAPISSSTRTKVAVKPSCWCAAARSSCPVCSKTRWCRLTTSAAGWSGASATAAGGWRERATAAGDRPAIARRPVRQCRCEGRAATALAHRRG